MLLEVLPLALLSAVYPALLAAVLLILSRPRPRRLLAGYLVGGLLVSMGAGLGIVAALRGGGVVGGHHNTVSPAVDFGVALIALFLLWVLLTDRDAHLRERREQRRAAKADTGRDPWSERLLERDSVRVAFLIGVALNLPGAAYLVALKDIARSSHGPVETVIVVLAFNLIMFLWAEIPLVGYGVAPERTQNAIVGVSRWLHAHSRRLSIVICALAAIYLLAIGAAHALG